MIGWLQKAAIGDGNQELTSTDVTFRCFVSRKVKRKQYELRNTRCQLPIMEVVELISADDRRHVAAELSEHAAFRELHKTCVRRGANVHDQIAVQAEPDRLLYRDRRLLSELRSPLGGFLGIEAGRHFLPPSQVLKTGLTGKLFQPANRVWIGGPKKLFDRGTRRYGVTDIDSFAIQLIEMLMSD